MLYITLVVQKINPHISAIIIDKGCTIHGIIH
jgi:hypothetical protein